MVTEVLLEEPRATSLQKDIGNSRLTERGRPSPQFPTLSNGSVKGPPMQNVRIEKERLQQVVQQNRDQHRKQYEKAFNGFAQDMRQTLEHVLDAFRKDPNYDVLVLARVTRPEDHTKDYDLVLDMLKMSADTHIVLTAAEFRQYVNDNWGWKEAWRVSNSKYLGDAGATL